MSIQGFPNDTKIGIFGTKICIPSGNPARKKREKSCLTKNLDLLPMYEIFLQNRLFEIWFPVESRRQNCFRHLAALSKGWITSAASRYPLLESFPRQTWSFKLFSTKDNDFPAKRSWISFSSSISFGSPELPDTKVTPKRNFKFWILKLVKEPASGTGWLSPM
jgi:hypothetical protein